MEKRQLFGVCFRTVSFQKVVKRSKKGGGSKKGFRTVSFQKVVKPFLFLSFQLLVLELCHFRR